MHHKKFFFSPKKNHRGFFPLLHKLVPAQEPSNLVLPLAGQGEDGQPHQDGGEDEDQREEDGFVHVQLGLQLLHPMPQPLCDIELLFFVLMGDQTIKQKS